MPPAFLAFATMRASGRNATEAANREGVLLILIEPVYLEIELRAVEAVKQIGAPVEHGLYRLKGAARRGEFLNLGSGRC